MCSWAELPDLHYFATAAFYFEAIQRERTTVDCQICTTLLLWLSLLRSSSVSVPLSTRSTVRRHLNFDVAGT